MKIIQSNPEADAILNPDCTIDTKCPRCDALFIHSVKECMSHNVRMIHRRRGGFLWFGGTQYKQFYHEYTVRCPNCAQISEHNPAWKYLCEDLIP